MASSFSLETSQRSILLKMPKIPKINITTFDSTRNSVCDPNEFSDVPSGAVTDCEFFESSPKEKIKKEMIERDVFLTDVEFSSEDDEEDGLDYPNDCIISMFDIGMNSEETMNCNSPNKSQRSVTCSLERFQHHVALEKYDDGGTDQEGILMSDEDIEVPQETDISWMDGNAVISMRDKLASPSRPSPCVTPDPRMKIRKTANDLRVEASSNALTDTEILSDIENKSRYKKFMSFNKWRDSSDSDSDSSSGRERYNFRKMNSSRSCESLKSKNKQVLALTPTEAVTDVEYLENENVVFRKKGPVYESRPTVIQRTKNVERPKQKKKETKKKNLIVPQQSQGYATDVEAFESDEDHFEETKAVDYIPGSKCELVLSNENNKGGVSLIMPIEPKYAMLHCEDYDCGYSDVEDLPGFILEEQRYPTPDLPRPERFIVKNSENMIDNSKLMSIQEQDPGTDIEEVNQKKDYLTLKEWLTESTTDVEDLHSGHVTDIDDFSTDEECDNRLPRSPELITSDTYVTSRDIFQNNRVPKILRISPSPIFMETESDRNESVIRNARGGFLVANESGNDPLTDVEEIDVQPKPKLCQKRKNVDTGSIKICFGNRSTRGIRMQGKESDKKQNQPKKQ